MTNLTNDVLADELDAIAALDARSPDYLMSNEDVECLRHAASALRARPAFRWASGVCRVNNLTVGGIRTTLNGRWAVIGADGLSQPQWVVLSEYPTEQAARAALEAHVTNQLELSPRPPDYFDSPVERTRTAAAKAPRVADQLGPSPAPDHAALVQELVDALHSLRLTSWDSDDSYIARFLRQRIDPVLAAAEAAGIKPRGE